LLHVGLLVIIVVVAMSGGIAAISLLNPPPSFPNPTANVTVAVPSGVPYRQLTTGAWNDRYPAWSPDGASIAYVSDKGGLQALWLMDASGLHQKQMSSGSEMEACPSWSPDSSKIAFWALDGQTSEYRVVRLSDDYTFSVPGSGPGAVQGEAAWSPDGSRLAFFTSRGAPQLMVYDFKNGASVAAAASNGSTLSASWASNEKLVYSTKLGGLEQILWVSPGTNQSGVVLGGGADFVSPSVGPKGNLAYYSNLLPGSSSQSPLGAGQYNIWTSAADGSNATFQYSIVFIRQGSPETQMIPYVSGEMVLTSPPAWSPRGNKVAYPASGTIFTQIFVWDVGNWTTACFGPIQAGVYSQQPTWSADGASIAFSCNLSGTYHIWVMPATAGAKGSVTPSY
jgi:Tol biopolymer transport system component